MRRPTRVCAIMMFVVIGLLAGCGSNSKGSHEQQPGKKVFGTAKRPPPAPPAHAESINLELRSEASKTLVESVGDTDPVIRAHAIEGIRDTMGVGGRRHIVAALDDRAAVVRFSAAVAVGELK